MELVSNWSIKRREWLVEEQNTGFGREGAGDRDPLLLSATQLVRVAVGKLIELHAPEETVGLAGITAERESNIFPGSEVGKEGILLEDHGHSARPRR
jgi:hypothetical protein